MHVVFSLIKSLSLGARVQKVSNKNLLKQVGSRLKDVRKSKNLTQEELAFLCDNHGTQIGRIERGELNVTISTLNLILEKLNITWTEFFDSESFRIDRSV
jgi:transcriptional regulator with XRE-family HTH domain